MRSVICSAMLFSSCNCVELRRQFCERLALNFNAGGRLPDDQVDLAPFGIRIRIVFSGMSAAALLALHRRANYGFADIEHVVQIETEVPAGVELNVAPALHGGGT